MTSLFNLNNEYQKLYNLSDEEFQETKLNLDLSSDEKIENVIKFMKVLDNDIKAKADEMKRIRNSKKADENKLERFKQLITDNLLIRGEDNLRTPLYKIRLQNSYSTQIIDIDKIPDEYVNVTKLADKTAIKNAIKDDSEIIDGAELQLNRSVVIK